MPQDFSIAQAAIQKRINLLYASMSFAHGKMPDWALFQDCFTSNAQLINNNLDAPMFLDVHTFVEVLQHQIQKHDIPQLYTAEIGEQTQVFGKIAQRFSVFANRIEPNGVATTKGINSLQLIEVKGVWLIQSLAWFNENGTVRIPTHLV